MKRDESVQVKTDWNYSQQASPSWIKLWRVLTQERNGDRNEPRTRAKTETDRPDSQVC